MDMWERYNKDSDVINKLYNKINKKNHQEIYSEIYMYIKSVTKYYYNNMQMVRHYKFLKGDLLFVEKKLRI